MFLFLAFLEAVFCESQCTGSNGVLYKYGWFKFLEGKTENSQREGIHVEFLNVREFSLACFKRTKRTRAKPVDVQGTQMVPGVARKANRGKLRDMKN